MAVVIPLKLVYTPADAAVTAIHDYQVPTETGIARAETLGPDGGQRIWKPGPDAAAGPTGAQESAPILFPSGSMHSGNSGGSRGGGPRGMGEEGGRPGAGTRHATQPPAGAPAGGRASTVVSGARLSQRVLVDINTDDTRQTTDNSLIYRILLINS